ncbi:MAG: site-specific integrase, partial [Clostridiales bacterium]|nr:site-specific integrase [Clostridiales bacterium]
TLAQARLKREQARQELAEGLNPNAVKREQAQERQAQQLTFKAVAERWYKGKAELAKKPWAPATAKKARLYLDNDLLPALGKKPIAEVTRLDLINLNEKIEKRGAFDVAGKVREWLNAIFDDAFDRGEISHNPAYRLKASAYAGGVVSKPNPNVGFAGLPKLLADVEATNSHRVTKIAIRLLALTAVRPAELRFAQWQEFDLEAATWHIPAERMKMSRPHVVPLSQQALKLIAELKALNPKGYLFVIRGSNPISENTINKSLWLAGYKGKQTGHGFRHLLSTELNERGYNSDWIEAQLAHSGENKIRAVYNHAEYLEQRRQMLQEWADAIDLAEQGANVMPLKRRA